MVLHARKLIPMRHLKSMLGLHCNFLILPPKLHFHLDGFHFHYDLQGEPQFRPDGLFVFLSLLAMNG